MGPGGGRTRHRGAAALLTALLMLLGLPAGPHCADERPRTAVAAMPMAAHHAQPGPAAHCSADRHPDPDCCAADGHPATAAAGHRVTASPFPAPGRTTAGSSAPPGTRGTPRRLPPRTARGGSALLTDIGVSRT